MSPFSHLISNEDGTPLVVALVEDDRLLREEIEVHLNAHGFEVHAVNSASALDDLLTHVAVDLYILDLGLPGESGLSLSRRLRSQMPHSGIVIMTARVALYDRIAGYQDGGADIYLTKPVAPDELVLVLRSLARRLLPSKVAKAWSLSLRDRMLFSPQSEQAVRLTHREKVLLIALIQAKDSTLESWALCDLFGRDENAPAMNKHTMEELIGRLRKKLKNTHGEIAEGAIKSVWGVGYQLCITVVLK